MQKGRRPGKELSISILVILLCAAFLSTAAWWPPRFLKRFTTSPLEAGATAPEFQAESLSGETVSLREFRGKPVLLKFWSVN